jgi:hypothetical protein
VPQIRCRSGNGLDLGHPRQATIGTIAETAEVVDGTGLI